jgi:hypothetical protein
MLSIHISDIEYHVPQQLGVLARFCDHKVRRSSVLHACDTRSAGRVQGLSHVFKLCSCAFVCLCVCVCVFVCVRARQHLVVVVIGVMQNTKYT